MQQHLYAQEAQSSDTIRSAINSGTSREAQRSARINADSIEREKQRREKSAKAEQERLENERKRAKAQQEENQRREEKRKAEQEARIREEAKRAKEAQERIRREAEAREQEKKRQEDARHAEEEARKHKERLRDDTDFHAKDDRYYGSVLGLKGRVSFSDVKRVYKELAMQYHPDKVSHLGPKLRHFAEVEMKKINEAYEYFKSKYG